MLLLVLSTRIAGSPTPFWAAGRPPVSPKANGNRMASHVVPPSVLRLRPTSMCSCRSTLLLYLTSYTPRSVPLLVVTKPGMRYAETLSSPACLTPMPILRFISEAEVLTIGSVFPSALACEIMAFNLAFIGTLGCISILTQK